MKKLTLVAALSCLGLAFTAGLRAADDAPAKPQPAAKPAPKPAPPKPTLSGLNPPTTQPTGTQDNTAPAGFVALFNGKDLTGWKGLPKSPLDNPYNRAKLSPENGAKAQADADDDMRQHWKAEDGAIAFDGQGRSLCTAKDYGDFEMWVDWKIEPKGDSGIYLRGSPQVQIWDPSNRSVGRAEFGSGALYNNENNPRDALVVADNPIGQWNTFFIRMVGDKVTVYLNGKLVTDNVTMESYWARQSKLGDQPIFPTGQIELQNHSSPLWFKNIYIKELPRSGSAGGQK